MKLEGKEYSKDDLKNTFWLGEVMDNKDPETLGRIRVKVYGKFDQLPTEALPWAHPCTGFTASSKTGAGFYSVPKVGSIVSIKFDNGNIYHPEYYYIQRISDELKEEIKAKPDNFHSLIYDVDEKLKIFYTQDKGLMIDYKETQINVKPDNSVFVTNPNKDTIELTNEGILNITVKKDINVKCENATVEATKQATVISPKVIIDAADIIELGKGATEKLILGDKFMIFFNKHTHIGNLSSPTSQPVEPMTTDHLSQKPKVTTK